MEPLFKLIQTTDASTLGAFKTAEQQGDTFGPAPVIVPYSQTTPQLDTKDVRSVSTLNVTNTFPWTNAPPLTRGDQWNARYDIPSIDLREESIQLNPALNNLARQLFIAKDNVNEIGRLLEKAVKLSGSGDKSAQAAASKGLVYMYLAHRAGIPGGAALATGVLAGGLDFVTDGAVEENLTKGIERGKAFLESRNVAGKGKSNGSGNLGSSKGFQDYDTYLSPYRDIYTTKLTGWRYKLPYLDNTQRKNTGAFGGDGNLSQFGGIGNLASGIQKATTALQAITSPGVYIDAAKSFMFGGDEKSYTVEFPLLNTGHPSDIIRNWQLLFLLTYQNRPNRIDRVQIAPPKIYQAMIPGVWYSKHAYISNMSVDFVGNRRKMTLNVPVIKESPVRSETFIQSAGNWVTGMVSSFINNKYDTSFSGTDYHSTEGSTSSSGLLPVTTIIPDAYNVSITVRELIPESQNTMFAAIHKPNTVTVSQSELTGSPLLDNMGNISNK